MSTLRANELKKLDDTNWVGTNPTQVPTNDMIGERGFEQAVDSVAALRLATFPASLERLWLSGYYGVGTAGGGPLYRDSADTVSADNGGTVFVDGDGVRWKRPETNTVNVKQFGGVGDGQVDDTTTINNALDYLESVGGGTLFFPNGTYLVHSGEDYLHREGVNNLVMQGESFAAIIKIKRISVYWGGVTNFTVCGLSFVTDKEHISTSADSSPSAFRISNFTNVTFDTCNFYDWGDSSTSEGSGEILNFFETEDDTNPGRVVGNSTRAVVTNCTFNGGDRDTGFAIRFYSTFNQATPSIYSITDCHVSNCTFRGFNWQAVEFAGPTCQYGTVTASYFEDCGITWAEPDKGCKDIVISSCVAKGLHGSKGGQPPTGIRVQGYPDPLYVCERVIFTDCVITGISARGDHIRLAQSSDSVVKDCYVSADAIYNQSYAVAINHPVEKCAVENVTLVNAYYGIFETSERTQNLLANKFKNITIEGVCKGPLVSLYDGNADVAPGTQPARADIIGLVASSDLSATSSIYTADPSNPALVQLREGGTSQGGDVRLTDCVLEAKNAPSSAGFIRPDCFRVGIKDCVVTAVNNGFFPSTYSSTRVKRIHITNISIEALFPLEDVLSGVSSDTIIYPGPGGDTSGYHLWGSGIPTNGQFVTRTKIHNRNPSAGGYIGWVCVASGSPGTWKGFGSIET